MVAACEAQPHGRITLFSVHFEFPHFMPSGEHMNDMETASSQVNQDIWNQQDIWKISIDNISCNSCQPKEAAYIPFYSVVKSSRISKCNS